MSAADPVPPYAVYPLEDADVPEDPEELAAWCVARVAYAGLLLAMIPLETLARAYDDAATEDTFGAAPIATVLRTALAFREAHDVVRELADLLPDGLPSSRTALGDA